MPVCGFCRRRFKLGQVIVIRDLFGKRRRVMVCSLCADRSRRVS